MGFVAVGHTLRYLMPDSESPPPRLVLSEAKLAPPRPRVGLLARPRLFTRLDELDDVALTLVSAPAGSGKTVVVASWLQSSSERSVAWVSLEQVEDEPVRLWTAVATSVDRLRPGIARPALATLRTPRCDIETCDRRVAEWARGFRGASRDRAR